MVPKACLWFSIGCDPEHFPSFAFLEEESLSSPAQYIFLSFFFFKGKNPKLYGWDVVPFMFYIPGAWSLTSSTNKTKQNSRGVAVTHDFNSNPQEAGAGFALWVQGQLGLEFQDSKGYTVRPRLCLHNKWANKIPDLQAFANNGGPF